MHDLQTTTFIIKFSYQKFKIFSKLYQKWTSSWWLKGIFNREMLRTVVQNVHKIHNFSRKISHAHQLLANFVLTLKKHGLKSGKPGTKLTGVGIVLRLAEKGRARKFLLFKKTVFKRIRLYLRHWHLLVHANECSEILKN